MNILQFQSVVLKQNRRYGAGMENKTSENIWLSFSYTNSNTQREFLPKLQQTKLCNMINSLAILFISILRIGLSMDILKIKFISTRKLTSVFRRLPLFLLFFDILYDSTITMERR
jgi:hypothetical protein